MSNKNITSRNRSRTPRFTLEQISQHSSKDDIWMAIHNKVYDVTSFLRQHPGGVEVLLDCAGLDATTYFDDVGHSEDSELMLIPLYKGELSNAKSGSLSEDNSDIEKEEDGAQDDNDQNVEENNDRAMQPAHGTHNSHSIISSTNTSTQHLPSFFEQARNIFGIVTSRTGYALKDEDIRRVVQKDNGSFLLLEDEKERNMVRRQKATINTTVSKGQSKGNGKGKTRTKKKKRALKKTQRLQRDLTLLLLVVVALVSAWCFAYLQQRKWK